MKNRTGIVILTIIITGLCLFYLSFSVKSRLVQNAATEYATDERGNVSLALKQRYLDSVWTEPVYSFFGITEYTYKEVKEKELNLGLDLQGGMHVMLEISPKEILVALSGGTRDADFQKALELASERQTASQKNYTELFFEAFAELAPNKTLASIFANSANKGRINFDSSDEDIKRVIEEEVEGAIDRTFNIIRSRIDQFGVASPNIQRIQGTGRIQIELAGVDNPQRIRNLLQGVAKLEFLEVWMPNEYYTYLSEVNDLLVNREKAKKAGTDTTSLAAAVTDTASTTSEDLFTSTEETTTTDSAIASAVTDTAAVADSLAKALAEQQNQISDLFRLAVQTYGGGLAYQLEDTGKINSIFRDATVLSLLPPNMTPAWAAKPDNDDQGKPTNMLPLYFLKKKRNGEASLTGEVIVDAQPGFDQFGRPDISMQMNVEGAKKWKKMTGDNINKPIAIALDNKVYSAPVVQGEIPNGSSSITGNFTVEETKDLSNILKTGKLPASPRIVEEVVVGPSLGLEAQNQGLLSAAAGFLLVVVFMFIYYSQGGLVSNLALAVNVFFILGILSQFQAALTLPGIAGIVLTVGMAVDANVLIFERIREELKKSPNLLAAIDQGYDRAFWTIFDSNITTLLTAVFLFSFGTGPVKGFAITLMIGIFCSFFTAVFVSRVIIMWMTRKGEGSKISFATPLANSILQNNKIDFMGMRKKAYLFSGAIIALGMISVAINGLNLGVDFQGGRSYVVAFRQEVVPTQLESALKTAFEGADVEVKSFGGVEKVKVTTNYMITDESSAADSLVQAKLIDGVASFTGTTFIEKEIEVSEGTFAIASASKVGATIADDLTESSVTAILFSLLGIFVYIFIRFRNKWFGVGAVVALFHDALIVIGIYSLANALGLPLEVDQVFVAAILTVIGYSINDTVVVFDRVREYVLERGTGAYDVIINDSINSTLNRTLMTSFTTLIVVIVLLLFGGDVLRGFSFSLFIGILFGTYSSIFIATPIVYDATKSEENRKASRAAKEATTNPAATQQAPTKPSKNK